MGAITNQVKPILLEAMNRLAKRNNENVVNIQLMIKILGKSKIDPSKDGIGYYYCIKGNPKMDGMLDEGYLHFVKEILGVKIDLMNRESLSESFFRKEIDQEANKNDLDKSKVIVALAFGGDNTLKVYLFDGVNANPYRQTTLEKVFGED